MYLFFSLSATTHEDRHVSKYLNTIDNWAKHFKDILLTMLDNTESR